MRSTQLVTAPTSEPVALADVLLVARVASGADDTALENLIGPAREHVEAATSRQLVEATRKLLYDDFPGDEIEIPRPPLQSITSVKYRDVDGAWQTLAADDDYVVDVNGGGATPEDLSGVGRIYLPLDTSWPDVYDEPNSVEILFVCGYPITDDVPTTPGPLKRAIEFAAADLYDGIEIRSHVRWLLSKYRVDWRL